MIFLPVLMLGFIQVEAFMEEGEACIEPMIFNSVDTASTS